MDGNVIRDDRKCGTCLLTVRMSTVALEILNWKLLWDIHVKIPSGQLDEWGGGRHCFTSHFCISG